MPAPAARTQAAFVRFRVHYQNGASKLADENPKTRKSEITKAEYKKDMCAYRQRCMRGESKGQVRTHHILRVTLVADGQQPSSAGRVPAERRDGHLLRDCNKRREVKAISIAAGLKHSQATWKKRSPIAHPWPTTVSTSRQLCRVTHTRNVSRSHEAQRRRVCGRRLVGCFFASGVLPTWRNPCKKEAPFQPRFSALVGSQTTLLQGRRANMHTPEGRIF